jgi:2-polyprenyl-6-hydroxyphenyl methylase / 3-demethylubiquinone-9 3-methyltransferase
MPIDNDVYNREGEGWWEEDNPLNILHGGLTPGRFAYFREILTDQLCTDLPDLRALGIGCGGGWRTADAAKPCMISVGAEISARSKPHGRRHLRQSPGSSLSPEWKTRPTRYQCHRCARI